MLNSTVAERETQARLDYYDEHWKGTPAPLTPWRYYAAQDGDDHTKAVKAWMTKVMTGVNGPNTPGTKGYASPGYGYKSRFRLTETVRPVTPTEARYNGEAKNGYANSFWHFDLGGAEFIKAHSNGPTIEFTQDYCQGWTIEGGMFDVTSAPQEAWDSGHIVFKAASTIGKQGWFNGRISDTYFSGVAVGFGTGESWGSDYTPAQGGTDNETPLWGVLATNVHGRSGMTGPTLRFVSRAGQPNNHILGCEFRGGGPADGVSNLVAGRAHFMAANIGQSTLAAEFLNPKRRCIDIKGQNDLRVIEGRVENAWDFLDDCLFWGQAGTFEIETWNAFNLDLKRDPEAATGDWAMFRADSYSTRRTYFDLGVVTVGRVTRPSNWRAWIGHGTGAWSLDYFRAHRANPADPDTYADLTGTFSSSARGDGTDPSVGVFRSGTPFELPTTQALPPVVNDLRDVRLRGIATGNAGTGATTFAAVAAGAGTGATVASSDGNDSAGKVTLSAGSGAAAGQVLTITFTRAQRVQAVHVTSPGGVVVEDAAARLVPDATNAPGMVKAITLRATAPIPASCPIDYLVTCKTT